MKFKDLKNIDRTTMVGVLEESFRSVIAKMFGTDENYDVIINPNKMVELYSFKENHKVIMTENGRVFEPFDVCNVIINPCSLIVLGKTI